eukprot:354983-Pyramimonas_sp.AAC.1
MKAAARETAGEGGKLRFIHLLTGGAASTSSAASRRVLEHFQKLITAEFGRGLERRLLVWACATQQGNM